MMSAVGTAKDFYKLSEICIPATAFVTLGLQYCRRNEFFEPFSYHPRDLL